MSGLQLAQSDANKEAAVAEGALEALVALAVNFHSDSAVLREVSGASGATRQRVPAAYSQGWPQAASIPCHGLPLRLQLFASVLAHAEHGCHGCSHSPCAGACGTGSQSWGAGSGGGGATERDAAVEHCAPDVQRSQNHGCSKRCCEVRILARAVR